MAIFINGIEQLEGTGGLSGAASDAEFVAQVRNDVAVTPSNMAVAHPINGTTGEFTDIVELANDKWLGGANFAGTSIVNWFKTNVDNEIAIGGTLVLGASLEGPEDGGMITLADMPVSATPAALTEQSFTIKIDGDNIFSIGARADSAGGVDSAFVKNNGAVIMHRTVVAAATYTLLRSDYYLGVSYTATGAVAITLATASLEEGRVIQIKDEGGLAGTNNITILTEGAETIDGSVTATLNGNYNSITLISNGSHWFIV